MQGAHQVAQKFRTSTLPPKEVGLTRLPSSVVMEKSGAWPPSLADVSRKLKPISPIKSRVKVARSARSALLVFTMPDNYSIQRRR